MIRRSKGEKVSRYGKEGIFERDIGKVMGRSRENREGQR